MKSNTLSSKWAMIKDSLGRFPCFLAGYDSKSELFPDFVCGRPAWFYFEQQDSHHNDMDNLCEDRVYAIVVLYGG